MSELIPAIIPKSKEDLEERVLKLKDKAAFLHVDVLPETFDPKGVKLALPYEVHFMFLTALTKIDEWIEAGAKRIILHSGDFGGHEPLTEILTKTRKKVEVGLAVKLDTDLDKIYRHIPEVDVVQLMSIAEIGEQGHPFDERIFDRIKLVREKYPQTLISIDGGIGLDNFQKLIDAGANRLVVGHNFEAVWSQMNVSKS